MDVAGSQVRVENDEHAEDAILDSLFIGCDTDGTGFVKASKLVEYLSLTVNGDNVDFGGNFNHLSKLLDPDDRDVAVDIKTYRKGMKDWIDGIRCGSFCEETYENENSLSYDYQGFGEETSISRDENEDVSSNDISSESVEGVGGESPQKQDWELVGKMEDLQLNYKRLLDRNAELTSQMENTEETNAQLLEEVEELQKVLRSYQCLDEKNRSLEKENEELQQTVTELQETSKHFQNKAKHLEKDKLILNESQEDLKAKLATVNRRLESLSIDHKTVCLAYNEEKQKLVELEELQEEKSVDKLQTDTREYLTNVIAELTAQKEELQMGRNKMEAELLKVREELKQLTSHTGSTVTSGTRHMTPAGKFITTTSSLQQEIQEMSFNDRLPSPLVGYSKYPINESLESDVFESSLSSLNHISLGSSRSSSYSSTKSDDDNIVTPLSQIAVDFRDKKVKALRTISELVRLDKTRETKQTRECLQDELEKEMEFFADKLDMLSRSQQVSERRVLTLLDSIGTLKDENKQLVEERHRIAQKLDPHSSSNDCLETRVETVTIELQTTLDKVKMWEKRCEDLQNEVDATRKELLNVKSKNETLASSLDDERNNRRQSENKMQEMEKLHGGLVKDHDNILEKMTKLENEVQQAKSELTLEKKRSFGLEESLSFSVSKHEDELQGIFEEIPDVTYDVQRVKSTSKPPIITATNVKAKLRELLANRNVTVRVSPDGKPMTREDEAPLYVSTPRNGNSYTQRSSQDQNTSLNRDILNTSHDRSWSSSLSSVVSPNLITPFQFDDEFLLSPSYVNPFEKNKRLSEPAEENSASQVNSENAACLKNSENTSLKNSENTSLKNSPSTSLKNSANTSLKNSPNTSLKNSSVEKSKLSNRSASLNSSQYSDDKESKTNEDAAPCAMQQRENLPPPKSKDIGLDWRKCTTTNRSRILRTTSPAEKDLIRNGDDQLSLDSNNVSIKNGKNRVELDHERDNDANDKSVPKDDVSLKKINRDTSADQNLVFTFDSVDVGQYSSGKAVGSANSSNGIEENCDRVTPDNADSNDEIRPFHLNLPADVEELQKLFKDVSQSFRTDQRTLLHRLESHERDQNKAEDNITDSLHSLSTNIQGLEKTCATINSKQALKDSLDSLCQQISSLKESSKEVSSKSRKLGCVQQEARMMSGVDVLINYGENISRRFETLSENVEKSQEHASNSNTTGDPEGNGEVFQSKHKEKKCSTPRKRSVKKSTGLYFKSCLSWAIRLIMLVVLFVLFISFGIRYSVIDRDFVLHHLQRNFKRFAVKHFIQEPAV